MPSRIEIIEQNSLKAPAEALIFGAAPSLLPETGLSVDIHQEAGAKLEVECRKLGPCPVGEARITRAHNLNFTYLIHAVPPVWGGGESGEDERLAACYKNALHLAADYHINSIAIAPLAKDTDFPPARAAHIAMSELLSFLERKKEFKGVILCCHDPDLAEAYEAAFDRCAV
jgi:O-acetyl-ADP-ribose deacetylase (regulator of RNase III)